MNDGCDASLIMSKATLVVVPPHLLSEWMKELRKHFIHGSLSVVCIERLQDLQATTPEALQVVDIVLVSSRLWESPKYQEILGMERHGHCDRRYIDAVDNLQAGLHNPSTRKRRDLSARALERFQWSRLIVDEAHELYALDDGALWA